MLFSSTHYLFVYVSKCIDNVTIHSIYVQHQLLVKQNNQSNKRMLVAKMVDPIKTDQTTLELLSLLRSMLTMWRSSDHQKIWKLFFKQLNNIHETLVINGIQPNVLSSTQQLRHQLRQQHSTYIINQFLIYPLFNILDYLLPTLALPSISLSINDHPKQPEIWHYYSN